MKLLFGKWQCGSSPDHLSPRSPSPHPLYRHTKEAEISLLNTGVHTQLGDLHASAMQTEEGSWGGGHGGCPWYLSLSKRGDPPGRCVETRTRGGSLPGASCREEGDADHTWAVSCWGSRLSVALGPWSQPRGGSLEAHSGVMHVDYTEATFDYRGRCWGGGGQEPPCSLAKSALD